MFASQIQHRTIRRRRLAVLAVVFATATTAAIDGRTTYAEGLTDQVHSLRLVPADAAFYSASLRIKEQWDAFVGSKAYARLMEIPTIQTAKMMIGFQLEQSPEPGIAMIREYLDSPAGKESLALVKEMIADEAFCYGSADMADLLELFMELNSVNRSIQFRAAAGDEAEPAAVAKKVFEWLEAHTEKLKVPDVVAGFQVRDAQRAVRQLDVLGDIFKKQLAGAPAELAARLKREKIGGHEFLTLRLDSSLIPWETLRAEAQDVNEAEFQKWKALAAGKTMVAAIGVVDNFVLASLGDSTEHLTKLGQGPLLSKSAPFARLEKHASQRVASVSYSSGAFMKQASSPQRSLRDGVDSISGLIKLAELEQELGDKLVVDIRGLFESLAKYLPEPGDTAAISFITPRGYEGFHYNYGTMPGLDSSQPLAVLNHLGGTPMGFVASHGANSEAAYDEMVKWLKLVAADAEKAAESKSPPADRAEYLKYRDRVHQLFRRLDFATREQVLPALRAGEQAIVFDVASKSAQWIAPLPKSPEPLPILEMGMVFRVSNAGLLRKGILEYSAVIRDLLKLVHEIHPGEIPEIALPTPQERTLADGAMYIYPFPAEWGVDSQLAANAALTEQIAVTSLQPAFTEQLLKPTPLAIDTSIDLKRPAAVVTRFEFAKLLRALRPWIDYGFGIVTGRIRAPEDSGEIDPNEQQAMMMQAGFIMPQVYQVLDVLSAFDSFTSATYREDDVWVTHSEMRIKDLE